MITPCETVEPLVIANARVVTPDCVQERGTVVIENGRIASVMTGEAPAGSGRRIDARGRMLLPGFVDIHGDSLERAIAPRPGVPFAYDLSILEYDAELATHGITTMYHCVGFAEFGTHTKSLRFRETARAIVEALDAVGDRCRVRCRVHARYEVLDVAALPILEDLVARGTVDLVSFMDHTPGFGVFKDAEAFRIYVRRSGSGSTEVAENEIRERMEARERVDTGRLAGLMRLCRKRNVAVATHDDHTREKVDWARGAGATICEFPVTEEAVQAARESGLPTVFGSPNLLRNGSHVNNLSATEMIRADQADIICSDYLPMSMLHALFRAAEVSPRPFHEVVRLFTLHPARAVGLGAETGSIETGKWADLVLVDTDGPAPRVAWTLVDGRTVFAAC